MSVKSKSDNTGKGSLPAAGSDDRACPKCGKPMTEAPKFKGYWSCPDYKKPLNDRPPYRYKCTGSDLTDEGAAELEAELLKQWLKRTTANN